jgi:transcriptional regulator with XRE-family HTH domain
MIGIEPLSVIRRWRRREYFSIREISRRTGLWRDTISKYLRTDRVETRSNLWERASAHAVQMKVTKPK